MDDNTHPRSSPPLPNGNAASTGQVSPDRIRGLLNSHDLRGAPSKGQRLGQYILLQAIGEGGFATVWRAEHTEAHTSAAVKVFNPTKFDDTVRFDSAIRFVEGATAMRKLRGHPNIVEIFEGPEISDGFLWFSMALVAGGDLSRRLSDGSLSSHQRSTIIQTLLDATIYAHAKDVVHRDIRPHNILLREKGDGALEAVLTDFDIAYYDHIVRNRQSTVLTTKGLGVFRYWPFDVFQSVGDSLKRNLRRKSNDLFAICVVIFDMFCGVESDISSDRRTLSRMLLNARRRLAAADRSAFNFGPLIDLLSKGLSSAESQRYRHGGELRCGWAQVEQRNRLLRGALPVALILFVVSAVLLLDLARAKGLEHSWARMLLTVVASLVGLGGVAQAIALVFLRWLNKTMPLALKISAVLERWAAAAWLATVVIAAFAGLCAPSWLGNFDKYGIVGGGGCIAQSAKLVGHAVAGNGFDWLVVPGENRRLRCEKGVHPDVYQASLFEPRLERVEVERVGSPPLGSGTNEKRNDGAAASDSPEIGEVASWTPLSEGDIRSRLLRSIRNSEGLVNFVRHTLEEAVPALRTPIAFGQGRATVSAFDQGEQRQVNGLRRKAVRMGENVVGDNKAVHLAIQGHLAALVLDCHAAANNFGLAFREQTSVVAALYRVWAMDAARCLGHGEMDDLVRDVTLMNPAVSKEFGGLVMWVIEHPGEWKNENRFLYHGFRLLSLSKVRWETARRMFVNVALGKSPDCQIVLLALELSGTDRQEEGVRKMLLHLLEDLEKIWQGRGFLLRGCAKLPEELEGALSRELPVGEVRDNALSRVRKLAERRAAHQRRGQAGAEPVPFFGNPGSPR